jgi:UDP-N-acetyl-D-mannosaminuronate dehydrogenase
VKYAKGLAIKSTPEAAAVNASVIAILTNDAAFKRMDWQRLGAEGVKLYDAHGMIPAQRSIKRRVMGLGRDTR